jgi:hypothetical protein
MKKIYLLILFVLPLWSACTDKFEELNTNYKKPDAVPGESLFSNAQKDLIDQISSTNVNRNVFKLFAQYWNETTYTDETNYNIITRNIANNTYRYYYRTALKDLLEAETIISATEYAVTESPKVKTNKLHTITLLKAYAYQQLIDIFGAVPYSEALSDGNVYPEYDAGDVVYKDLIQKVSAAVSGLDAGVAGFGSADVYYGGDVSQWIKFGNSLKVKLGITLADYDAALAKQTIQSGLDGGVFKSSSDNTLFAYQTSAPNTNPIYLDVIASGRHDFVPANTIVDIMNNLEDPRRPAYFDLYEGKYVGGRYGYTSPYNAHSHIPAAISKPDFTGILFTYSEVQFYLAEAAARGFITGSAEDYYKEGIKASFDFWGISGADEYIAKPEVAYSAGDWQHKIALQSWLAFYTRGLEGWTVWRRLDYPVFNVAQTLTDYSEIPARFTFPSNEQSLNAASYKEAAAAIGGDKLTSRIFWDKN